MPTHKTWPPGQHILPTLTTHCILGQHILPILTTQPPGQHILPTHKTWPPGQHILPTLTTHCILGQHILPTLTTHCILGQHILPTLTTHCILGQHILPTLTKHVYPYVYDSQLSTRLSFFPGKRWSVTVSKEGGIYNRRKEGNVLFNNTLNTFFLTVIWRQTYGKGPLCERGNPLLPHGLLFPINSKGSFICTIPQTG